MRTGPLRGLAGLVAVAAVAGTSAAAPREDANKKANVYQQDAQSTSIFSFNYGPPSATSVDLLGLDASKIAPASSLGPFVLALPSVFDGSGGQYAGLDISPAWLLASSRLSAYPLKPDYFREELFRLRLDLGLTNGAEATDPAKQKLSGIAFGFSLPLLPHNNPLRVHWNRGGQTGDPYFRQCLNAQTPAFRILEAEAQGTLAVTDPEARWAGNELLRYDQGRFDRDELDRFLRYVEARYGPPGGATPPPTYRTPDEAQILGRVLAWSKSDAHDPMANTVGGMAEMLAQIDGVTPAVIGQAPAKAEVLPELLHFLMEQPADKAGVLAFRNVLTGGGVANPGRPEPPSIPIVLVEGSIPKTIASYRAQVQRDTDAAGTSADQAVAIQAKRAGTAALITACAKGASALAATEPDLSIGAGYRQQGDPGHLRNLDHAGGSIWLSGRFPLARGVQGAAATSEPPPYSKINSGKVEYLMLGGSLRYDDHMRFITGDAVTPAVDGDKLDLWAGLEGYNGWGRLSLQAGYSKITTTDRTLSRFDQHGWRWLTSGAFKLGSSSFWLGATYGNANGTTTKLHDKTFLVTVFFAPPAAGALLGNADATKPAN
jgi:hypothetical protein